MTNNFRLNVLQIGCAIFALCAASFCQPASANGDHLSALSSKVSLLTKSTLVQGEPIILQYSVFNISDRKIVLDWAGAEGYSLALMDQVGNTVAIEQKQPPKEGYYLTLDPVMRSGGKYETCIAVPQHNVRLRPGRYTLMVRVRLPYTTTDSNEENPLKIESEITASGNIYSRVFRIPLTVTAPNDGALRATAASLLKTLSAKPYGPEYIADVDALFSMPEAQAAPSWQRLLAHPGSSMNIALIIDKLGDVKSVKSADMLLKMLDSPTLSSDNSMFVSRKLEETYNSGDFKVRSHLKNTMAQRGITLPDRITVSQPTD